jgi:CRISPR/Cas system-associated exonuclease Cas4 (RecB family)
MTPRRIDMGLALNISNSDRDIVLRWLNVVREVMVDRRTDDGIIEAITQLLYLVEMEAELDSRSAALLYTSLEAAIPGIVKDDSREALERVRDRINRDGDVLMKQARRKAFH